MPPALTLDDWVVASPEAVTADVGAEAVVLDLAAGKYYGMPGPTAMIWAALQSPVRIADIVARLLDAYDVEPDRCRRELLAVVADLEARGLVRRHATAP